MSSQQKKREKALEKREREGWPGLVELGDVYGFEWFLTHERPWRAAVPDGDELMRVTWGEHVIVVRYDAQKRKTIVNRRWAMVLYHDYLIFHKERIERMMYHEQVD